MYDELLPGRSLAGGNHRSLPDLRSKHEIMKDREHEEDEYQSQFDRKNCRPCTGINDAQSPRVKEHGPLTQENGDRHPHHHAKTPRRCPKEADDFCARLSVPQERSQGYGEKHHPSNPTDRGNDMEEKRCKRQDGHGESQETRLLSADCSE